MVFKFNVRGDRIRPLKDYEFVEGNRGSYEAFFDFEDGSEWDKVEKLCVVECGEKVYHRELDINGKCILPEMEKDSVRIGVLGVTKTAEGEEKDITPVLSTNMHKIGVIDGAASSDKNSELNTAAEVWQTYLADMGKFRDEAKTAAEDAEAAKGAAETAKTNAAASALAASEAASAAQTAQTAAEEARDDAEEWARQADGSAGRAEAAAEAAYGYRGEAEGFKNEAQTAAESASGFASAASESASAAQTAQTAAETAKTNAAASASQAVSAKKGAETAQTIVQSKVTEVIEAAQLAESAAERAEEAAEKAEAAQKTEAEPDYYNGLDVTPTELNPLAVTVLNDGTASIQFNDFPGNYSWDELVIPYEVEYEGQTYPVSTIGNSAFWEAGINRLIIPNTIKLIDEGAFHHTGINEIIFCGEDIEIRNGAFQGILASTLNLPKNVRFYNAGESFSSVFADSPNLTSVELPEGSVKSIEGLFQGCTALEKINIPECTEKIEYAFTFCSSLKEIAIPKGVKKVTSSSFLDSGIKTIYYEGTKKEWESILVDDMGIGMAPLEGITILYDYTDGNILTAEYVDEKITEVNAEIDGKIAEVNAEIDGKIAEVNAEVDGKIAIIEAKVNAFGGLGSLQYYGDSNIIPSDASLFYPSNTNDADGTAYIGFSVEPRTLEGEIVLPYEIEFEGKVYKSVGIGNGACYMLSCTSLIIPSSIKVIEPASFWQAEIEEITFCGDTFEIQEDAFMECTTLTDVYYRGSRSDWNVKVTGKENLPENVTVHFIGSSTYAYVDEKIDEVKSSSGGIDDEILSKFNSLQYYGDASITPSDADLFYVNETTEEGTAAISSNYAPNTLTGELVIPYEIVSGGKTYKVTKIMDGGFWEASNINKLIVPSTVEIIGSSAFYGSHCSEVVFCGKTMEIGAGAFTAATDIYYRGSAPEWETKVTGKENLVENTSIHFMWS